MRTEFRRGFTLLELLVVLSIIALLVAIAVPSYRGIRAKAEKAHSIQNLKSIYTALSGHLNAYRSWPQAPNSSMEDKFEFWKKTLAAQGLSEEDFIANAHKRRDEEGAYRTGSYLIMEFDPYDELLPRRYENQPWVMEMGNFSGDGAWMIRADGTIDQELPIFQPTGPSPASSPGKGGP